MRIPILLFAALILLPLSFAEDSAAPVTADAVVAPQGAVQDTQIGSPVTADVVLPDGETAGQDVNTGQGAAAGSGQDQASDPGPQDSDTALQDENPQTGETQQETQTITCTPNWSCTGWGAWGEWTACQQDTNQTRTQARECSDTNSCSVQDGKPATSQSESRGCAIGRNIPDDNSDSDSQDNNSTVPITGNTIQVPGNLLNLDAIIQQVKEMVREIVAKVYSAINAEAGQSGNDFVLKQSTVNIDGKIAKCFGIKCEEFGPLDSAPLEEQIAPPEPDIDVDVEQDGNNVNVRVDVNLSIVLDVTEEEAEQAGEILGATEQPHEDVNNNGGPDAAEEITEGGDGGQQDDGAPKSGGEAP